MKKKRSLAQRQSRRRFGMAALLLIPGAASADIFQAPYGPGGTWRIYETVPGATLTFRDALEAARAATDPVNHTVHGDLVSITSAGKESFVYNSLNLLAGDVWMGLADREGVAPDAQESQTFGTADEANRINGWKFTNGDVYSYMHWNAGEPNNAGNAEDAVHFNINGWNDNMSGYGDELPESATLQPGTSTNEENSDRVFRYVIEYSTNAATPYPGIRVGSIIPPNTTLPGDLNTAGNWSVREIRGLTLAGNIFDAINQALEGQGTPTLGSSPYLDFTDPDTNAGGGPVLTTTPFPFLTNVTTTPEVSGDDNNILSIAKTRIKITTAGDYTFQVHSDDGFALRVKGQTFTAVSGAGYIDPLDTSTLIYAIGTGDSNTRGVVNLAVGEYDVEFVHWEGGGGAFYEVTSASGSRLNPAEAQWLPLGSNTSLAAINTLNTVYLKTSAQVDNANIRDRGAVLPAMRAIMAANVAAGAAISAPRPNLELQEGNQTVSTDLDDITRMPFNNSDGTNADNYITKVEGSFKVAADANGNSTNGETIEVTFGLFCDDGASMRIIGQDFEAVSANSTLPEVEGDKTLTADFYTGNTNSYGRIQLKEGQTYEFVCYMYEGGGGSNFNLRWELGDFVDTGFDGGQIALRTAAFASAADPINLVADATVTNCSNAWATAPVLPAVRQVLTEAIAQVPRDTGNRKTADVLVLRESGSGSITGGGFVGNAVIMPVGAVDNYATRVTGRIVVNNGNATPNENVELTFALFADDGCDLHIIGQDFTNALDNTGDGTATLEEIGGDTWLVADFFTGNTNTFGHITLKEGEYDFEGNHYEGGGGSGYEIWYAPGTLTAFDANVFRPLSTNPGQSFPANIGVPLVAGVAPPAANLNVLNFTYNSTSGAYSLTFSSNAGSAYRLEYTIGFEAMDLPTSAQKWNTAPGANGAITGAAGSTTITGNISDLITPAGQLPNKEKAFFRVRAL